MASMREWLKYHETEQKRVIVVHCKAGKGRSGTIACSYLISEEEWTVEDALMRFTARRMRSGFGNGVSIPSQLRWIGYVDWWSKHGRMYVERQIEVLEVHVWGLRDGVKVAVEGYVEEGKIIKTFHTFGRHERIGVDSTPNNQSTPANLPDHINEKTLPLHESKAQLTQSLTGDTQSSMASEPGVSAVIFHPAKPIILPTSDINIDFERRNKATYGFTMVTSVAHVWFNAFFESQHPSTSTHDLTKPASNVTHLPLDSTIPDSGVFEIAWEAMDGIKGSARKGTRALDRLAVVWRAIPNPKDELPPIITEPTAGEPVPESKAAAWDQPSQQNVSSPGKDLGLRTESPSSANVSKASSMVDVRDTHAIDVEDSSEANHRSIPLSKPSSRENASSGGGGIDFGVEKVESPC